MNIKIIIAGIIGLPIILYVLSKGAMEYKARSFMDQEIASSSSNGVLTYKDLETDVRGQTKYNEISMKPNGVESSITIDQVVISGPGPIAFVTGGNISGTDIPKDLHIFIDNLHIPLDDDLIAKYKTENPSSSKKKVDGCSAYDFLTNSKIIKETGINDYSINAVFKYKFNTSSDTLFAELDIDIAKIGRLQFSLDLESVKPDVLSKLFRAGDYGGLTQVMPALASTDLSFNTNKLFATKYKAICAEKRKMTVSEYEQYLHLDNQLLLAQLGVTLGYGLKRTLKKYIKDWGEIRISIRPDTAYPFEKLAAKIMEKKVNLASEINLDFSLNNDILTNLNYTYKRPTRKDIKDLKDAQASLGETDKKPIIRYENKLVEIPKSEIIQHKNEFMHLTVSQSRTGRLKILKGYYVEKIDQYIHLKVRVRGSGTIKIPTRLSQIKKVQIYKKMVVKN